MSSSSQLSSHSLSPLELAAPGAAPFKCARSVCESSQSDPIVRYRVSSTTRVTRHTVLTRTFELLKLVVLFENAKMGYVVGPGVLGCFGRVLFGFGVGRGRHGWVQSVDVVAVTRTITV